MRPELEEQKKYNSAYQGAIDSLLSNMGGSTQDPMQSQEYKGFRNEYANLANTGVQNAIGDTNALTGGYNTTYANKAVSQASQQYLTEMNRFLPSVMEAAQARVDAERQNIYTKFATLSDAENRAYGRFRDERADQLADRSYEYQKEQDDIARNQWQQQFDYTGERDKVKDEQWQKQFDEQKREFDLNYALAKAKGSGGSGGGSRRKSSGSSKKSSSTKVTSAEQKIIDAAVQLKRQAGAKAANNYIQANLKGKAAQEAAAKAVNKAGTQNTIRLQAAKDKKYAQEMIKWANSKK